MSKDVKLTPKTILFSCLGSIFVFVTIIIICIYAIGRSVPDETSNQENTISQQSETSTSNPEITISRSGDGNSQIFELLENTYTREIESLDSVKIEYDSEINTYVIYATKSGASETLQLIKHGYEDTSIWTDVVSSVTLQVSSSCIQAREIDENASIMFNLLNDRDETKTLLSIINGNVLYNALNDE